MQNSLKIFRLKAHLKQMEVAQSLNIKQCTISNWECGRGFPKTANLIRLSVLYHCTINELYPSDEKAVEKSGGYRNES